MVTICYLGSAVAGSVLAVFLLGGSTSEWIFIALVGVTFFLASAGASSAYLTVSEIFPMETRALAIAFFYAVGTAVGGITGPLLFGHLIDSGHRGELAIGFVIGAVVMAIGGIAELFFGVDAEGQSLESIAEPLTASDGDAETPSEPSRPSSRDRSQARRTRESSGLRRYRPGVGASTSYSPHMAVSSYSYDERELDREVDTIESVLRDGGPLDRDALATAVHARAWGPGRFRLALREAIAEGKVRQLGRRRFGVPV